MAPLKVWSTFSAKKGGASINLRIVDAPESVLGEVINQYMKYYVTDDPTFKAAGVTNNAAAMEELRVPMLKAIKEKAFHTMICCLDTGDDQIKEVFGASMMVLTSKGDPEPEFDFKTEEMKKLFDIFCELESLYDEAKALNSERYFSDRGLFINPEYSGLGIELEFIKARRLSCKENGISVCGAWMTSSDTQKAAESDGWATAFEIPFEELGTKLGVTFDSDPPSIKFMIAKIQ
ncbi:hypothetical protein PYW07_017007 [Mythimna separata]|uniref:Uncharacterized protein n=1 Tax=Mythimna separata TaxID=271217 RepID=A0AAD7YX54_MYTSE|nr:hypothetical protein PYW07_017007 [Mythimna separata]